MTKRHSFDEGTRVVETVAFDDRTRHNSTSLQTSLSHLSPVGRDESGIAVTVNEPGRYATLNFDIPEGLPLLESARARLEAVRARRIEYTDHTDREYEMFFDFPPTEWTWAAPFVHEVRDARRHARESITQELRRVALDYLAGTVRKNSAEDDALRLLRRMMLRDEA